VSTPVENDFNMIPGQTYTFKLNLENLITKPTTSTMQADLQANAPSFVNNNMSVTWESQGWNWTTNVADVQFTYNGDGSDVISDVANAIIATLKSGSNDDFTFVAAYADNAGNVNTSSNPLTDLTKPITDAATDILNKVGQQTSKTAQDVLTPVEIAVGIVVVLVIALIFTAGKSGGVSGGPEGFKVGG